MHGDRNDRCTTVEVALAKKENKAMDLVTCALTFDLLRSDGCFIMMSRNEQTLQFG